MQWFNKACSGPGPPSLRRQPGPEQPLRHHLGTRSASADRRGLSPNPRQTYSLQQPQSCHMLQSKPITAEDMELPSLALAQCFPTGLHI